MCNKQGSTSPCCDNKVITIIEAKVNQWFASPTKKVCSKVTHGSTTVKDISKGEFATIYHATEADCVVTGYEMAVAQSE